MTPGTFLEVTELNNSPKQRLVQATTPEDEEKVNNGDYTTRLLIPATNFTQCFAKLGYKAIKAIFDAKKVDYAKRTINNSSHLKKLLEDLDITRGEYTVSALDIKDMYPSIKFKLIETAIDFYSINFNEDEKNKIRNSAWETL